MRKVIELCDDRLDYLSGVQRSVRSRLQAQPRAQAAAVSDGGC